MITTFEVKNDGTPEETIKSVVEALMAIIKNVITDAGADPCAVSCTIAGSLLEQIIENGHQGCAAHVAIDTLRYASGEQPVSQH